MPTLQLYLTPITVVARYMVEVGVKGISTKPLYNLLKDFGLSRTAVSIILERASAVVLAPTKFAWD